jgi:hypothetical protein
MLGILILPHRYLKQQSYVSILLHGIALCTQHLSYYASYLPIFGSTSVYAAVLPNIQLSILVLSVYAFVKAARYHSVLCREGEEEY